MSDPRDDTRLRRSEPESDLWKRLRRFTSARLGLGRAGASLPTQALLNFDLAHARARDAVHSVFSAEGLAHDLQVAGFGEPLIVSSQAGDRMEYLLRPDLGRILNPESRERMEKFGSQGCRLVFVIADGLSAVAPTRHALPLLQEIRAEWNPRPGEFEVNVTVVVANRGRVALGDDIGGLLDADAVVVLIGERPGLSSPDSLGIYLTWAPRIGRTDAERNCISNVRPEGLPYREAARRLVWLLSEARRLHKSGIALKDDSDSAAAIAGAETSTHPAVETPKIGPESPQ